MRRVSYFQQFSQREDHTTNNILLALLHFHRQRPNDFGRFVSELVGEEIVIGPVFGQQVSDTQAGSRLDGLIEQRPFVIGIETKLGDVFDDEQMARHADAVGRREGNGGPAIILGLRRTRSRALSVAEPRRGVRIVDLTFTELVDMLERYRSQSDETYDDLLTDLRETLSAGGLLTGTEIVLVPSGQSLAENMARRLYYHPAHYPRLDRRARFIGLYHEKQVRAVGRITSVVTMEKSGDAEADPGWAEPTPDRWEAIRDVAERSDSYGSLVARGSHRFYLVDEFAETDMRKASAGGVFGRRYLDVTTYGANGGETAAALAAVLQGRRFE